MKKYKPKPSLKVASRFYKWDLHKTVKENAKSLGISYSSCAQMKLRYGFECADGRKDNYGHR